MQFSAAVASSLSSVVTTLQDIPKILPGINNNNYRSLEMVKILMRHVLLLNGELNAQRIVNYHPTSSLSKQCRKLLALCQSVVINREINLPVEVDVLRVESKFLHIRKSLERKEKFFTTYFVTSDLAAETALQDLLNWTNQNPQKCWTLSLLLLFSFSSSFQMVEPANENLAGFYWVQRMGTLFLLRGDITEDAFTAIETFTQKGMGAKDNLYEEVKVRIYVINQKVKNLSEKDFEQLVKAINLCVIEKKRITMPQRLINIYQDVKWLSQFIYRIDSLTEVCIVTKRMVIQGLNLQLDRAAKSIHISKEILIDSLAKGNIDLGKTQSKAEKVFEESDLLLDRAAAHLDITKKSLIDSLAKTRISTKSKIMSREVVLKGLDLLLDKAALHLGLPKNSLLKIFLTNPCNAYLYFENMFRFPALPGVIDLIKEHSNRFKNFVKAQDRISSFLRHQYRGNDSDSERWEALCGIVVEGINDLYKYKFNSSDRKKIQDFPAEILIEFRANPKPFLEATKKGVSFADYLSLSRQQKALVAVLPNAFFDSGQERFLRYLKLLDDSTIDKFNLVKVLEVCCKVKIKFFLENSQKIFIEVNDAESLEKFLTQLHTWMCRLISKALNQYFLPPNLITRSMERLNLIRPYFMTNFFSEILFLSDVKFYFAQKSEEHFLNSLEFLCTCPFSDSEFEELDKEKPLFFSILHILTTNLESTKEYQRMGAKFCQLVSCDIDRDILENMLKNPKLLENWLARGKSVDSFFEMMPCAASMSYQLSENNQHSSMTRILEKVVNELSCVDSVPLPQHNV